MFEREYSTEHYVFYYHSNSAAECDIKKIAAEQERCFEEITNKLQIEYPTKIKYYLCNSKEEVGKFMEELYGDYMEVNGVACVSFNSIYAVYNKDVKCLGPHEDTHIISYEINYPECLFLSEGLAMFFDAVWWGYPNKFWCKYYKNQGLLPRLEKLLDDTYFSSKGDILTYPIAGYFVEWFCNMYSMEIFLDIFKECENHFEKICEYLKLLPEEFEQSFLDTLEQVELTPEIEEKLKELFETESK